MKEGKAPGFDSFSVERLRYVGVHVTESYSYLLTFQCISYVVPVVKNTNNRTISLAIVISKVYDSMMHTLARSPGRLQKVRFSA